MKKSWITHEYDNYQHKRKMAFKKLVDLIVFNKFRAIQYFVIL